MTVTSIRDAWAEVQKIFPTRYEHDASRSERAGYPIYYSTASGVNAWISDLGNRLEVNLPDGKSANIWIQAPAEATITSDSAEETEDDGSATKEERRETAKRMQMNELKSINGAYARLVPDCLLRMLRRQSVTELKPGDHAPVDGALLILIPRGFSAGWASLDHFTGLAAELIAQSGGMLVDYDEGLYALTALLPEAGRARACALSCLERLEQNRMPVMAALLTETVELGVFGGESLLYPLAVSRDMRRKQAALERVLDFGALLVETGRAGQAGLRLLGWDNDMEFYEDPACRPSDWQSRWRGTAAIWEDALRLYRERDFSAAMRLFAKVLRRMPEDQAVRWYLFRCDALRGSQARPSDTELLFDWGKGGHE